MRYLKKLQLFFFLLPFMFFPLTSCTDRDRTEEVGTDIKIPVRVATVRKGNISEYLYVTGTTLPLEQARVGAKVEGTITEILADEGDEVKKGQVLIRLDPRDFLLDVDRTKASLKTALAELEKAEHDLEQKSKDWKRLSALYERKVIAKHRYDAMKASFSIAQARVKEAGSLVRQREAELGLAEKKYQDSVVCAPFDGFITKKLLHEGEVSSLWAYNWETLEIMNLRKIKVECDVSEKYKAQLQKGMEARIEVDAYPDKEFNGKITTVNPNVDPVKRTFRIKILIPNIDQLLTAGMFARIKVMLQSKEQALVIPIKEVIERLDGNFVFVVQDGVAQQRKISLGLREAEEAEVTDGLTEGEMIVIKGSHRLQDGYKVAVTK